MRTNKLGISLECNVTFCKHGSVSKAVSLWKIICASRYHCCRFYSFSVAASIFRLKLMHQKQSHELKSAHGEAYGPYLYGCIIILPLLLQYIFLSWCQVTEVTSIELLTKDEEAVGLTPYSMICSVERKSARFPELQKTLPKRN